MSGKTASKTAKAKRRGIPVIIMTVIGKTVIRGKMEKKIVGVSRSSGQTGFRMLTVIITIIII